MPSSKLTVTRDLELIWSEHFCRLKQSLDGLRFQSRNPDAEALFARAQAKYDEAGDVWENMPHRVSRAKFARFQDMMGEAKSLTERAGVAQQRGYDVIMNLDR